MYFLENIFIWKYTISASSQNLSYMQDTVLTILCDVNMAWAI